ncbi:hypothetical protein M569_02472 [Genlisea aurea]|uniref:YbaK/aminoacyl-tRNA synthetase-associated domain-containing protein n=1 Tax=Genlisea aurea TaxID=192259 RepID=S8D4J2_9LAMI|nr:hypothetical protein M569_02472 [Genlisea aurea]
MGYTKEKLLSRLEELHIKFSAYEHPVVLTVEAQAKYVGHQKGALSKNLFLKDKKQRFYIVSALADTKVDLKVLSQRLGLGKGGIRMAPEEALAEILQARSICSFLGSCDLLKVPLGCVTPFALINESARHVSLLLDQGFKIQECCFFHPLSNDASISLAADDLDKFLVSIGKTPAYVDLEANPAVGKDQPPDLAIFVPTDAKDSVVDLVEKRSPTPSSEEASHSRRPVDDRSTAVMKEKGKPSSSEKSYADPEKFLKEILEKTASIVISEVKGNNWIVFFFFLLPLRVWGVNFAVIYLQTVFKNAAYAEGFRAGVLHQPKRL